MNRAALVAIAVAAFSSAARAQNPVPPTPPPSEPTPPNEPVPAPAPRPKAVQPLHNRWDFDFSDIGRRLDDMKMNLELAPMPELNMDLDFSPMVAPNLDFEMPNVDLDFEVPNLDFNFEMPNLDFNFEMPPMPDIPAMPDMAPIAPMTAMQIDSWTPAIAAEPAAAAALSRMGPSLARIAGQSPFERQFGGIASEPPRPWAQSDPADSLYRVARQALNRGEYRRAAQLFGDISQRFPNSVYAADARYWRAFALYRIGDGADLRDALAALQDTSRVYRQASLQTDAAALAARIRGALAAQGDPVAREQLGRVASGQTESCDREDLAVRIEALNSLGQTDPESTTPILRRLLARKDECSTGLRRAAVWLLGRRTDADATSLITSTARNDPDIRVRAEALRFLAAMPGDQAISTIEEIARTPGNEQLQQEAIMALGRSDNPRAHQSIRAIVERNDLSEELRATALASIDAEHSSDNGAYVRSIYPGLNSPRLKAAALRSLASIGGSENEQWLLSVVRNVNESPDVRAMALRYAGRSSIPITDLVHMYDVADARSLREQLIRLYAQRTEPQATDKLLEIARNGTDPDTRRFAISALSRKNDPRTKQLLLEIIDK
jgi:HEAT repeat protein